MDPMGLRLTKCKVIIPYIELHGVSGIGFDSPKSGFLEAACLEQHPSPLSPSGASWVPCSKKTSFPSKTPQKKTRFDSFVEFFLCKKQVRK